MNKKCKKKRRNKNNKRSDEVKYICPECGKNKNSIKLNDGYTVCLYCGLVVLKPSYSLELIDAPGFIDANRNKKHDNYKKLKGKHHNLAVMKEFIKCYTPLE